MSKNCPEIPAWTKGAYGAKYRMKFGDAQTICKGFNTRVYIDWKNTNKTHMFATPNYKFITAGRNLTISIFDTSDQSR